MENKEFVFEAGIVRLEEIVRLLERGDAVLEESLKYFEEGMKLISSCGNALNSAEQKLKILVQGETPRLEDFEVKE